MDTQVRLEPARPSDAREIATMSRDLVEQGLAWRWRPQAVMHLLRDSETETVVARRAGRICGFAIMSFRWERATSHLILLAVKPTQRRLGFGRELVRWLEVIARRGGITRVELEVRARSDAAQRFYESLGYTEIGRIKGYYQGREDALRMASPVGRRRERP